jgi:hypothetical protein
MPALFWLSSYIAGCCLAVAPQSSTNDEFYATIYSIALHPICVAQNSIQKPEKIVGDKVKSQN